MPTENTDNGTSTHPWTVYPIFHLEANWISEEPEYFDLDIQLIRADDGTLKRLAEEVGEGAYPLIFPGSFDPKYGDVRWLLAVRTPQSSQTVSSERLGISFKDKIEDAICHSFLTCLKVVRSTAAVCPISCPAIVRGSHVEFGTNRFSDLVTADAPRCDWPERFEEADLPKIREVWSGLVQLRNLARWRTSLFRDGFFRQLDIAAGERTDRDFRRRFEGTPLERLVRDQQENLLKTLRDTEIWQDAYKDAFSAVFRDQEEANFNSKTRMGRAIGVFEEGVHLPQLHAFLSVCLVLETLLTTDSQEVTHKLATRLAKIVGDEAGPEEKADLFKRVKKVYKERSLVVHGEKSIAQVDEIVRKDAFGLTRRLFQKILCNKMYLGWFTVATNEELDKHFMGLDLG